MKDFRFVINLTLILSFSIFLSECKEKEQENFPPVIQSISAMPSSSSTAPLPAGESVSISIVAVDGNKDPLYYSWYADGGEFIGQIDKNNITWKSPDDSPSKLYKIVGTISDGINIVKDSINIYVKKGLTGTVKGFVYYSGTRIPISGVTVNIANKSFTTSSNGYYELHDVPQKTQILSATKQGYDNYSKTILVDSNDITTTIEMTSSLYTFRVYGNIKSKSNGNGMLNVRVSILNPDGNESNLYTYTDNNGYYQIPSVPQGTRKLKISQKAYFITELFLANTDYLYNAEFETEFIDSRDGKSYKVVQIGNQTWMAENLNYGATSAGDCYASSLSNCTTYGKLYTWNTIMNGAVCPTGWHVPTLNEYIILISSVGDSAGYKMVKNDPLWGIAMSLKIFNESGFSVIPGGFYDNYAQQYRENGSSALFWTSSYIQSGYAHSVTIAGSLGGFGYIHYYDGTGGLYHGSHDVNSRLSLRCIKN